MILLDRGDIQMSVLIHINQMWNPESELLKTVKPFQAEGK